MNNTNAAAAILNTNLEVEEVVERLAELGFDMSRVSVAGRDQRSRERVVAYYKGGDRIWYWGAQGDAINKVWVILAGWAFLYLPVIGPVLVAGPLAHWIITALNNAPIFGEMSALGMGLHTVGLPRESIARCESSLVEGKHLLLVHGSTVEVQKASFLIRERGGLVL